MTAGYHLTITLLDRSSPNSSRRILRGSPSTRSAGRTPHPTSTGLPGELDFRIANAPSYAPPQPPGFWADLSQAPTTRLGERWDDLADPPPISPTAFWYEPQSIVPPSATAQAAPFTPAPTLDYRFGPISLDWIDHPASHPAFSIAELPESTYAQSASSRSADSRANMVRPRGKGSLAAAQHPAEPSTSSLPPSTSTPTGKSSLPAGRFIPAEGSNLTNYQLGSTEFGYGSIHLYRDFEEATCSQTSTRQANTKPGSGPIVSPSRQKELGKASCAGMMEEKRQQDEEGLKQQEDIDGLVIGVLCVPSYMTSQDFLAFISSVVESIESVRMLRDALPNRCIGLIKFRSRQSARSFASEFNGKPFSHLQDREICHTAFIRSVSFKSSLIPPFTFPALLPPDLITQTAHELPTCPVCLERMDASVTGLMTNTCSHTFHCHCLSNWGDSRCPICRYSQAKLFQSAMPAQSECAACGSTANLWICLICGHVGCGRYQGGHAYRHFEESAHLYALELGSQRVWDYVGDNYVHRLIQTKSDQIVELPALSSAVFDSGGGPGRHEAAHQSKIEAISEEFGHLVASQLDSQRGFYEEEMAILRRRTEAAQREAAEQKALTTVLEGRLREAADVQNRFEEEAQREKGRLAKKVEKALETGKRLEAELKEEQMLSEGMRRQLKRLEDEKKSGETKTSRLEGEVAELKEQLRDLMFYIDAQSKIQDQSGSELQGGSIVIGNPTTPKPSSAHRKKKK